MHPIQLCAPISVPTFLLRREPRNKGAIQGHDLTSCFDLLVGVLFVPPLGLRSWPPSKEVPKPRPGKVPEKCFEKCRSETGCREKCRNKCSGCHLLYYLYIGAAPGALISALFSAPRFGPALSEALFRHFSGPGLRRFDGGQDRNSWTDICKQCSHTRPSLTSISSELAGLGPIPKHRI